MNDDQLPGVTYSRRHVCLGLSRHGNAVGYGRYENGPWLRLLLVHGQIGLRRTGNGHTLLQIVLRVNITSIQYLKSRHTLHTCATQVCGHAPPQVKGRLQRQKHAFRQRVAIALA